jgi:flagellar motor switch protein FliM
VSSILSEEEIEALLRGVAEGSASCGGSSQRGGVQHLDLTSQERSLRGRLPGLELVIERFVRALRPSLAALVGQLPEVHARGLELVKFARVTAQLPEPAGLVLFRMPPLRGQGLLVLGPPLASALLEAACGGIPGRRAPAPARELSAIDQRVLVGVAARVLQDLRDAFRPLAAIEFGEAHTEATPRFAAIAAAHDLVIALELAIALAGVGEGALTICLPNAALDPVRQHLQAAPSADAETCGAGFGDRLRAVLAGIELEVVAELGTHRMRLRDVLALGVGDVIPLRTGSDGPVLVRVEGRPRFIGAPGLHGSSNAVRVTARI